MKWSMRKSATRPGHSESRRDIQGLRAIAVVVVALNHAGVPNLGGGYVGVDVFFVISGFLITGLLLRRAERDGQVSFIEFYARRAIRIVPMAALVLVVIDIAARQLLSPSQAKSAVADSVWSVFFAANVRFGQQKTDYFAQDQAPSPVQHFWSLAVEEQFYVLWPLVLAVALFGIAAVARRKKSRRSPNRRRLVFVLLAMVAASLMWSSLRTADQPALAYFSSLTRAYELGVGALVAVLAPYLVPRSDWVRWLLGVLGLIAIGLSVVLFSESTVFPGYAALLPTGGAAAVIVGGLPHADDDHEMGIVNRGLGMQPLRYVGDLSYSFYLWHWPVLILAAGYYGEDQGLAKNLALLAGAFALSSLTYHLYENPLRKGALLRPDGEGMALTWAASCSVVVLVAMLIGTSAQREIAAASVNDTPASLGESTSPEPEPSQGPQQTPQFVIQAVKDAEADKPIPHDTVPAIEAASEDYYDIGVCSGYERTPDQIVPCQIGDPAGSKTVVVFGDSHAEMWLPAIRDIGKGAGYLVFPFTKPGCGVESVSVALVEECESWYEWAKPRIAALRPDIVILIEHAGSSDTSWVEGTIAVGRQMQEMSGRVVVVGDSPVLAKSVPDCLQGRGATLGSCASPPGDYLASVDQAAAGLESIGLNYVQVSQYFCANDLCPGVMGNVVVYRDTNHITETYARQIADLLEAGLNLTG